MEEYLFISEHELSLKHWKELEHVHYLLNPKDGECKRWAESIKRNIQEKEESSWVKK